MKQKLQDKTKIVTFTLDDLKAEKVKLMRERDNLNEELTKLQQEIDEIERG